MKLVTRGIALVAALMCLFSVMPLSAVAETGTTGTQSTAATTTGADDGGVIDYTEYLKSASYALATEAIKVTGEGYAADLSTAVTPQQDAKYGTVYKLDDGSAVTYKVNVPKNGAYTIAVLFGNLLDTAETYDIAVKVDGAYPFAGCDKLQLNAIWEDDGGVRELANGDQVNPAQKQVEGFIKQELYDVGGIALGAYRFYLAAGEHTVTVEASGRSLLVAGIELGIPEQLKSYDEVSAGYGSYEKYDGDQIVIEAENSTYRNSYSLTAKSDNGVASVSPSDPEISLINHIGGTGWSQAGQEITWSFTAPKSGLYKVGFAYKQDTVTNGDTYRWMKIDGKTPFTEATEIAFPYEVGWRFKELQLVKDGQSEDMLVYLSEGPHTVSMTVSLADVAEVFSRLEKVVNSLGALYLDIVMITSESPDPQRDYELHLQIPGFEETLKTNYEELTKLAEEIGDTLQVNGELQGAARNMARICKAMTDSLYEAHLQLSTFYSAHQTLSAWLYDIRKMNLSIDQIIFAAPDKEFVTPQVSWWKNTMFAVRRFINSFVDGSSTIISGDDTSKPTLKIWVNWGRDQVRVLNTLIQDTFDVANVKVEQVNASLVQGVISGNSPDLYLHMGRSEPVNLAMRGVLYDLRNFDDFEEVLTRFHEDAEIPYEYRDGCYAIPDTQGFDVMFYRTDILEELNIEVPTTWDEFKNAMGILQRNNMNVYLPYGKNTLSAYPTLLLQKGGSIYTEDKTATAFRTPVGIAAFTEWTDYYTKYSLDQEANFMQKFRVGTMPIGIASYSSYLTYKQAAPEINGKWKIATVPGTVQEDGTVNNVVNGNGSACAIMATSKEKEAAWEFVKWWTSSDTQYRYSAEVEAILGETGRVMTATTDAVSRLAWDPDALKVILKQWDNVIEIEEVPGSYYVGRSVDQAFWATKNGESSSKEAIIDWSDICDKEIERKYAEYADVDPDWRSKQ